MITGNIERSYYTTGEVILTGVTSHLSCAVNNQFLNNLNGPCILLALVALIKITTTTFITQQHRHPLPNSASRATGGWAGRRGKTCVGSAGDTTKRVPDMLAFSTPTCPPPTSRRLWPAPATDLLVSVFDDWFWRVLFMRVVDGPCSE